MEFYKLIDNKIYLITIIDKEKILIKERYSKNNEGEDFWKNTIKIITNLPQLF